MAQAHLLNLLAPASLGQADATFLFLLLDLNVLEQLLSLLTLLLQTLPFFYFLLDSLPGFLPFLSLPFL